jgi:hypothetical protein
MRGPGWATIRAVLARGSGLAIHVLTQRQYSTPRTWSSALSLQALGQCCWCRGGGCQCELRLAVVGGQGGAGCHIHSGLQARCLMPGADLL